MKDITTLTTHFFGGIWTGNAVNGTNATHTPTPS